MSTWATFETEAGEIAARWRWLIAEAGGVAFLATVRRDGSPQVRPIMPFAAEGRLWALIVNLSSKHEDLLRDGRFALHAIPAGPDNLEVHLSGRVRRELDPGILTGVVEAADRTLHDFESLFEFDIERAQSTKWQGWGTADAAWPEFLRWRA